MAIPTTQHTFDGKEGQCTAHATGPKDLLGQGFPIQPGQSHDVLFAAAATYAITCPIHRAA